MNKHRIGLSGFDKLAHIIGDSKTDEVVGAMAGEIVRIRKHRYSAWQRFVKLYSLVNASKHRDVEVAEQLNVTKNYYCNMKKEWRRRVKDGVPLLP